jgi:release factor glutamine methyltransferase
LKILIQKRSQRIPLQHLVGSVGFYGLDVQVSPNALIPRPETELLVETVIKTIHSHQRQNEPLKLLDLATGTGCIALALAKELPMAQVWGLDISESALNLARKNASNTGLEKRVTWIHSDLWKKHRRSQSKMGLHHFKSTLYPEPGNQRTGTRSP